MKALKATSLWLGIALACALQLGCATAPSNEPPIAPGASTNKVAIVNAQLGLEYVRNGQLDVAWERLNTALSADPNYATAHNGMALVYDRLNEPAKAEKHFKRAIELNPGDSAAQTNYGVFLCARGRIEEGVQYFMKAVENPLYDKPALAYTNAGLCKLRAGDRAGAEDHFRAALRADPRFGVALLNMAELSFEAEQYLAARGYMQRYEQVSRHNSRSLWLGIRIERKLGDKDAVSSLAMLLKANYPDSPETRLLIESGVR
ncbi:MAG: type IV pilus biogenesis/stability protein PilW [Gammaproteobacteria bacterium]|nr:type IV pilus biogenesis/stability protein PilW [Gammaproteobacteria bacterium]NIM75069.1 type IV pilus biogenesis/stability protein PilW [Gammaproteobacteria bacterium]NIN40119.1 type IV pilus biogenesis/stability protein PilW [Gammaproteobacteria bacterium]NIO26606.1 type IV pilus biogenesis/stability protein PilW [Gammaproteobacteria bacterium]NIO67158.1 type IV pilus biogenesis/stability protein PilW [Gammaproteobacteria bacterium]